MGPGIWQLLVVLAIIILLFGTKKLRNMGGDLGSAFKSFKGAIKDEDKGKSDTSDQSQALPKQNDQDLKEEIKEKNEQKTD